MATFKEQIHSNSVALISLTMIRDLMNLMNLMPAPAPAASDHLFRLWNEHINTLAELVLRPSPTRMLATERTWMYSQRVSEAVTHVAANRRVHPLFP